MLNFTNLGNYEETNEDYSLPVHCSSIEELAFSGCTLSYNEIEKLIKASKRLRRLTCMDSCSEHVSMMNMLSEEYGHCLESLILDETYKAIDHRKLRNFRTLKSFHCLDMSTLLLERETRGDRSATETDQQAGTADAYRDCRIDDLREIIPIGIESITITNSHLIELSDRIHKELLHTVADLVEDHRFAQLRVVCILYFTKTPLSTKYRPSRWDAEGLDRIKAKGVDLHCNERDGVDMEYKEPSCLHPDPYDSLTEVETDPTGFRG